jgi:hypothetical protein
VRLRFRLLLSPAPGGCLIQTTEGSSTTFTAKIPKAPKPKKH